MKNKAENKVWKLLAPVVVLVCISFVITAALAFTNQATAPIIEAAQKAAADAAKKVVLPAGSDFTTLEDLTGLPENVTEVNVAGNGAGYVFTVSAKGYDKMSVMVGVGSDGACTGTQVLVQAETEGIGSKVVADGSDFQKQLIGMKDTDNIQAVSGATFSSNGMKNALRDALDAYTVLSGGTVEVKYAERPVTLTDEVLSGYYPGAAFTEVPGGLVSDAGTVVFAARPGMAGDVPVAVCFDPDGKILGAVADTSKETPDYGLPLDGPDFMGRFAGVESGSAVDGVSGATITSDAIKDAVDDAIANLATVKGAA